MNQRKKLHPRKRRPRKQKLRYPRKLLLKKRVPAVFGLLVTRKAPEGAGLAEVKKNSKILELLRDSLGVDHGYDSAAWEKWWKENEGRFRDVP